MSLSHQLTVVLEGDLSMLRTVEILEKEGVPPTLQLRAQVYKLENKQ